MSEYEIGKEVAILTARVDQLTEAVNHLLKPAEETKKDDEPKKQNTTRN